MTGAKSKPVDQARKESFAESMIDMLNKGALAVMVSIGHRTGLFDAMSRLSPSTSAEIAGEAGLNERYVREWLGAMVTGRVVEFDPEGRIYRLPPEHAAFLTRAAAPDNIAAFTQYIPMMGTVEDQIVECFRKGGGVPYSSYRRFHEVMAEDSGQTVVPALIDHILPLVPGFPENLKKGIEVLDIGCGSGKALNLMAEAFPNSRLTGYDFSKEGIAAGKAEAKKRGLDNLYFEVKDATSIGQLETYDLITAIDAIHDQAKPHDVLPEIHRALRPGGTFLMQDIGGSSHLHKNLDLPMGPFLYSISCMHCMTVSLAEGGAGLGTMWGEEMAREMLVEAGFSRVEIKKLPHDLQNYYYIARK